MDYSEADDVTDEDRDGYDVSSSDRDEDERRLEDEDDENEDEVDHGPIAANEKGAAKARSFFAVRPSKRPLPANPSPPPFSGNRIEADSHHLAGNKPTLALSSALLERDRIVHHKIVYELLAKRTIDCVLELEKRGATTATVVHLAAAGGDGAREFLEQWQAEPRTVEIELKASDLVPGQDSSSPVKVVGLDGRLLSPFAPGSAQVVNAQNCFYSAHVCFRQIEDMLRLLEPGGCGIISVHGTQLHKIAPALLRALRGGQVSFVSSEWHGTDRQEPDGYNANLLLNLRRTDAPINSGGTGILLCRGILGLGSPAASASSSSSSSSSSFSSSSSSSGAAAAGAGAGGVLSTVQRLKLVTEKQLGFALEHERLCIKVRGKEADSPKDLTTLHGYVAFAEVLLMSPNAKDLLDADFYDDIVRIAEDEQTSLFNALMSKTITTAGLKVAEAALRAREAALQTATTDKDRLAVLEADIGVADLIDGCDLEDQDLPLPAAGTYAMGTRGKKQLGDYLSKAGVGGNRESKLPKRIAAQKPNRFIVFTALPEDLAWRKDESEEKRLLRESVLDAAECYTALHLGGGQSLHRMCQFGDVRTVGGSAGGAFLLIFNSLLYLSPC